MNLKQRKKIKKFPSKRKTNLYIVAVGTQEYNYVRKIINDEYSHLFHVGKKLPDIIQMQDTKNYEKHLSKVIDVIKNRINTIKNKDGSFVLFITDLDNGTQTCI